MTAELYTRTTPSFARDRRRILMLVCAFAVASFVWLQVRFPLQQALASSNIGNADRNDLVFDTIRRLHPEVPEHSGLHWSARSRSGPPLAAVSIMGGYTLFDDRFVSISQLQTNAGFATNAADRDKDGCYEFAMYLYGVRGAGNENAWVTLRRRDARWELIGLAQITNQRPIGAQWIVDGERPKCVFLEYAVVGGAARPATEVARFEWTRPGGVLRARFEPGPVFDCMPGDDPIVIAPEVGIDETARRLVEQAHANRKNRAP